MAKKELIASYPKRLWAEKLAKTRGGTAVREVYKCIGESSEKRDSRGQSYLEVKLYDVTGEVTVNIFPERLKHCELVSGQTVELDGELRRGDHAWWVVAKSMSPKPIEDIEMVTPVAYRSIEDMESDLEIYAGLVDPESPYWRILALFMDDEREEEAGDREGVVGWRHRMRMAPKSDFFPLSYVGGVLEEVVKRTKIVIAKCDGDPDLRRSVLIVASILGNTGLLRAFESKNGVVLRTRKGRADHEAIIARDMIRDRIKEHDRDLGDGEEPIGAESKEVRAVIHCVLGLHRREFLPMEKFGIREAEVLHNADKL